MPFTSSGMEVVGLASMRWVKGTDAPFSMLALYRSGHLLTISDRSAIVLLR